MTELVPVLVKTVSLCLLANWIRGWHIWFCWYLKWLTAPWSQSEALRVNSNPATLWLYGLGQQGLSSAFYHRKTVRSLAGHVGRMQCLFKVYSLGRKAWMANDGVTKPKLVLLTAWQANISRDKVLGKGIMGLNLEPGDTEETSY